VFFHCNEDGISLSNSDIKCVGFGGLGIDTVDFHDLESVVFDVEVLRREGSNVDESEKIGLPRLDGNAGVHGVVKQECVWNWFCATRVVE